MGRLNMSETNNTKTAVYTDKCFAKLILNNKILRANDKLHPASLKNWRRIFAGTDETYVGKDGKERKINSLIGIEIVDYDKNKTSGEKTGNSLEYNLSPENIKTISKNIERGLNYSGVLFSDMKTHSFVKRQDGKGEVISFELKREPVMSNGAKSKYPYAITIKKGWATLLSEGVGYSGKSYEQDSYLVVRLTYADITAFFDKILDGIEIFKIVEGSNLRRKGVQYEFELQSNNKT